MELLTQELIKTLPAPGSTEHEENPIIKCKFFNPCGKGTWYVLEYDPEERRFFGLVDWHTKQLGYFSLDELEAARLPFGLRIERDLHFKPTRLSEFYTL